MALLFFCAAALGQLPLGVAALCAWIAWNARAIISQCAGVLAPAVLMALLYVAPPWLHCLARLQECDMTLNVSDTALALVGIACFISMAHATAGARTRRNAVESWWPHVGSLLLLGVAAARLVGVADPIAGDGVAGHLLFVTANDAAFAPIFFLLCIGTARSCPKVLVAHAVAIAVFAILAASVAESRLVVIVALIAAGTLLAVATRGDRNFGRMASIVALVALIGAAVAIATNERLSGKLREVVDASLATRAYLVETALRLWSESPLLGKGPGAFEASYASAHAAFPPSHEIDKRFVSWPHNAFVEMLLEKGLAGVVSLIVAAGWLYRRSVATATMAMGERSFGGAAVVVSALLFVLLAFVETSIHRVYFLPGAAAIIGALVTCGSQRAVGAREVI